MTDMIKVLDSMTNLSIEGFQFISGDSSVNLSAFDYPYFTTTTVKIDKKDYEVEAVALFDLNVISGKAGIRRFAYRLKGIDGVKLAGMVSGYWYYVQLCNINQYKTLVDASKGDYNTYSDDHKTRFDVLERRIKNAVAICNRAKAEVVGIEECAKNIVRAYIVSQVGAYGDAIKEASTKVLNGIADMLSANVSNADLRQVKSKAALKNAIADLKCKLFPVGGCVTGVHHKCTSVMFEKVYMCAYKRTKAGKSGLMYIQWAKRSEIVADIILQVVHVMQEQQILADIEKVIKD